MTLFSEIIAGNIPGRFVYEGDLTVAFLTIEPLSPGHVLVVPKAPINHWDALSDAQRDDVFRVAQLLGQAIKKAYGTQRAAVVIAGFDVPHTHVHVFGANHIADLDLSKAAPAPAAELASAATTLRNALREMGVAEVSQRG